VTSLNGRGEHLALIQPFGLSSPAGGPRILRALVGGAPIDVLSLCTGVRAPPATTVAPERYVPLRPLLPFEGTRLGPAVSSADLLGLRRLGRRIDDELVRAGCTRAHVVAHGLDFWPAFAAARRLGLPTFLSVHDDLRYNLRELPYRRWGLTLMGRAWRSADHRFVITEALGREYDMRYGARPWTVVTDGVEGVPDVEPPEPTPLRVWFMGSLHLSYGANLAALLAALPLLDEPGDSPGARARLICRGGTPPLGAAPGRLDPRPFASEAVALGDLREVHVAYLPLPLGREHSDFVRFSLPTKLITYLACGRPLLVHGPADSSTAELVRRHGAGVVVESLDPAAIAEGVRSVRRQGPALVAAARELARRHFDLDLVRERFWTQVLT
jgi:hypothetical protein